MILKVMDGMFAGKTIEVGELRGKHAVIKAWLVDDGELAPPHLTIMVNQDDLGI